MAEQGQQGGPGPPASGEPFPGDPNRAIRLSVLPFGRMVDRSVFRPNELAWIDAQVEHVKQRPALWVPQLMAHHEAHRVMTLDIGKLARGSVGFMGTRRGFPLRAGFVANWSVYETLWRHYLANKEELASQLQSHPYEAEVLRKSKYFGPAISGIQVGSAGGPGMPARPDDDSKTCPFCAETIKAKALVCRYCNRDLPSDTT
jgi:hypothetical protein